LGAKLREDVGRARNSNELGVPSDATVNPFTGRSAPVKALAGTRAAGT
jgi:hypothetical protein